MPIEETVEEGLGLFI